MDETREAGSRGVLRESFRLFHLNDSLAQQVENHYHVFDKIVIPYSGNVSYIIEGVSYRLLPGDVLFVRHHDIHKPLISADSPYERVVIWIDSDFLSECGEQGERLDSCFSLSDGGKNCLFRPSGAAQQRIRDCIEGIERCAQENAFGDKTLRQAYFRLLMVELNRCVLGVEPEKPERSDSRMNEVIAYINSNLKGDLSVETLSSMCYLSRFYFMRRFKEATGMTVHAYVTQKRLARAAEMISNGASAKLAASDSGFDEYSTFLRSFKSGFGVTPAEFSSRSKGFMDSAYEE